MKKINFILLSLTILFSYLSGSPNLAAGNIEISELPLNNTSLSEPVLETAPLNSEFLELKQSDTVESISYSDYRNVAGLGYTPSPVNLSGLSKPAGKLLLRASGSDLPTTYDLREEGYVTPAQNQGQTGSCWAFSSIASIESYILRTKGESRDFSENNMKNLVTKYYSNGFDLTIDDGGNAFMSMAYLTRWTGPVNDSEDPFNETSHYSPTGLPVQKHVQEAFILPDRTGSLDNEYIKKALMEYGGVYSIMYWNLAYYKDENYTYYYTDSNNSNHAVTIIGWNDSFDKNKFSPVPPTDGAFIAKNSWGETWGEEGYFYISYYDSMLGYNENAVFTATDRDNFDYIYQYDPLGWVNSIGYAGNLTIWGGNIFSSQGKEKLEAVGFYTTDLDTTYDIYIYKNPTNGPINQKENFVAKETGTCSLPGYHTHLLNSPVSLTSGENFSVVIKFSNPSSTGTLAIENPIAGYSSKARANSGESFISQNGTLWEDITSRTEFSDTNICIKAFTTVNTSPEAEFTSNITSWTSPLTVQFTDLSKNAFSWEWDFNGDGIVDSTVQNPVYTYTSYGNYTVSLNVNNRKGLDSETKIHYITVTPLTIISANPEENITTYEGNKQEFNISINHNSTVNWYLSGEKKSSESGVKSSSYSNSTFSPGIYIVTALARAGDETVTQNWNWTISYWNPWNNSTSQEGENISTEELQEAIHIFYKNDSTIPQTGAKLTSERLREIIRLWREGSAN